MEIFSELIYLQSSRFWPKSLFDLICIHRMCLCNNISFLCCPYFWLFLESLGISRHQELMKFKIHFSWIYFYFAFCHWMQRETNTNKFMWPWKPWVHAYKFFQNCLLRSRLSLVFSTVFYCMRGDKQWYSLRNCVAWALEALTNMLIW